MKKSPLTRCRRSAPGRRSAGTRERPSLARRLLRRRSCRSGLHAAVVPFPSLSLSLLLLLFLFLFLFLFFFLVVLLLDLCPPCCKCSHSSAAGLPSQARPDSVPWDRGR